MRGKEAYSCFRGEAGFHSPPQTKHKSSQRAAAEPCLRAIKSQSKSQALKGGVLFMHGQAPPTCFSPSHMFRCTAQVRLGNRSTQSFQSSPVKILRALSPLYLLCVVALPSLRMSLEGRQGETLTFHSPSSRGFPFHLPSRGLPTSIPLKGGGFGGGSF